MSPPYEWRHRKEERQPSRFESGDDNANKYIEMLRDVLHKNASLVSTYGSASSAMLADMMAPGFVKLMAAALKLECCIRFIPGALLDQNVKPAWTGCIPHAASFDEAMNDVRAALRDLEPIDYRKEWDDKIEKERKEQQEAAKLLKRTPSIFD